MNMIDATKYVKCCANCLKWEIDQGDDFGKCWKSADEQSLTGPLDTCEDFMLKWVYEREGGNMAEFNFKVTVPEGKEVEFSALIGSLAALLGIIGAQPGTTTNVSTTQGGKTTSATTTKKPATSAQIAAIHAIYIDIGKKTGKTLTKEERVTAVRDMLGLNNLESIDDISSWQASKVISALKETQAAKTETSTEPF